MTDDIVLVAVIGARFVLPLLIPRFPLPALLGCLVLDAADREIFELFTNLDLSGYQAYDKALDVFYLSVAMLASARNWTNVEAVRIARWLFYYRLIGVALFELTGWRAFLLLFPNTFEYFFIAYEVVRTRWSPDRLSRGTLLWLAAGIWVVVKLPQEYWIHIAGLDVTDLLGRLDPLVATAVVASLAAATAGAGVAAWRAAPAPDHGLQLAAGPLPVGMAQAQARARYVSARWRVLDLRLAEKIVLVALVTIIFAQVLPGVVASPTQQVGAVAVIVTYNSLLRVRLARAGRAIDSVVASFVLLTIVNVVTVAVADAVLRDGGGRLDEGPALFFLLLLTLIVTMYDRWHPLYEWRVEAERAASPAQ